MIKVLVLIAALGFSSTAFAQPVTSYTLTIYAAGTSTVIGTPVVMPLSAFACNQPFPSGGTVNPNKIVFNDVTNAAQSCVYVDPGTGPLSTLPFGAAVYEATLAATNSAGTSAESARALPFSHPGQAPFVPTGVRVIR